MSTKKGNQNTYRNILIIASLVLTLAALLVAQFSRRPGAPIENSTQYLGLIALIAVGIERVMEGVWTVIDVYKGSWWPKNLKANIDEFISGLGEDIKPFIKKVDNAIETITKSVLDGEKIEKAKEELAVLKEKIEKLKTATGDVQQMQRLLDASSRALESIEAKYPQLKETTDTAYQILNKTANFLDTFKENPGRQLISLYIGAILGVIIAGVLGLDVFIVTIGMESAVGNLLPNWGVALTGILMGLGSSPTHEVIRAIEEIKKSKKG